MTEVSDGTIIVTWTVFATMLYIAIQQTCVQTLSQKDWVIYRIFLTLTILNENIVCLILLTNEFPDDKTNQGLTMLMRSLVWCNNFMGTYIVYKLGVMAATWMYRQLNPNTTRLPSWFLVMWTFIVVSNAIVTFICAIISIAEGNLGAIQVRDIYVDFLSLFINLLYIGVSGIVASKLHEILRRKRELEATIGRQDTRDARQVSRNNTNTQTNAREISRTETENAESATQRSLKRIRLARNKLIFIFTMFTIAMPMTLLGTISAFNTDNESKLSITEPVFVKFSDFRNHFVYSLFYEGCILIFIYQNTKCCANDIIKKDTMYIYLLNFFHLKGFQEAYWFCKMFPCLPAICDPTKRNLNGSNRLETTGSKRSGSRQYMTQNSTQRSQKSQSGRNNNNNKLKNVQSGSNNSAQGSGSSPLPTDDKDKGGEGLNYTKQMSNSVKNDKIDINKDEEEHSEDSMKDFTSLLTEVMDIAEKHRKDTLSSHDDAANANGTQQMGVKSSSKSPKSGAFSGMTSLMSYRSKSGRKIFNDGTENARNNNKNKNDENREDSYDANVNKAMKERGGNDIRINIENNGNGESDKDEELTPTQRRDSVTNIESTKLDLDESIKEVDLRNIDYKGRKKHKREKAKANKTAKNVKEEARRKANANEIIRITDLDERDPTRITALANKEETYAPYDNVSIKENTMADGGHTSDLIDSRKGKGKRSKLDDNVHLGLLGGDANDSTGLNTFKKVYNSPTEAITLTIFEFEDVLCTNTKSIENCTSDDIANTDLKKMLLSFGGVERLEELHECLSEVIMTSKERSCFLLTKELSETVFKVLERVDMAQYFISLNETRSGKKKKLSHVIGCDHKLFKDADGKKHLLLFKLMKFLKRDHDSVLYIGNNRETIEHLNKIDVCHTYWVQTKGLIHHDLTTISENFFFTKLNNNENDGT